MNAPTSPASENFFHFVWKLVRMRLLLTWNSFIRARTRRKIGTIVLVLLVLGLAGFIFYLSTLLLGFLNSTKLSQYIGIDTTPFLQAIPVLVLTGLFMGIFFSSFGVLLQALYLSGDMDFLLTSPVPVRAVFVSKLLEAVLPNLGLIALFGLPVLFGLGFSYHYAFLYYPLVVLCMAVLALAAAGLAGILVMLAARTFPPRRVAEVLGFIAALLAVVCGQSGNLYNAFQKDVHVSGTQVNTFFTLLIRLNSPWIPLNWPGKALVAAGEGRWLTAIPLLLLTMVVFLALFWLALLAAERWYYTGWAAMQVVGNRKKIIRRTGPSHLKTESVTAYARRKAPGRLAILPAPVGAIVQKDFKLLRRDMRNMSQLISPIMFGIIYTIMFMRPGQSMIPTTPGTPPAAIYISHFISTYGAFGMALFVGWILLARLAGLAFSSEGRNYWILKSAPLKANHLLAAKFLVAYLPSLALGLLFILGISFMQKASIPSTLYGIWASALCLAGMSGILLSTGVLGANFTWTDPRRMNAGSTGCLGQLIAALFLPVLFGLFIGPLLLLPILNLPEIYGYLVGGVVGTIVAVLAAVLPPRFVRNRVERLGEE
jgi:ABC-2 type transport system permease protein